MANKEINIKLLFLPIDPLKYALVPYVGKENIFFSTLSATYTGCIIIVSSFFYRYSYTFRFIYHYSHF